ncbi:UPF0104 family protein [Variovorax paradoxus]|nr:UPF0104 family protein [Variovorax paradoxus]
MPSDASAIQHNSHPRAASSIWRRSRRWILAMLGVLLLVLLLSHAHKVDWAGAWEALRRYPPWLLFAALGLATTSHAVYGCFDLVGRRHTRHALARWRTWAIAVTSYAFNLNLGSLVGTVGMRARLYGRAGLDEATIAQIVGLSLATNWLGYALLAGSLFAAGAVALPGQAHLGSGAFRALGAAMVLLALGYVVTCALSRGREWRVRGRCLRLPSARLALVQLGISAAHWALTGSAMYLLLGGKVSYTTALGVLMTASIAGVLTPIPAGLGVLEAVYLALLAGTLGDAAVMGAVLAYRALYYLVPLGGALLLYVALERHAARDPPRP